MRHDPFAVHVLIDGLSEIKEPMKPNLQSLQTMEEQAILLVSLFKKAGYLTIQDLRTKLEAQRLPPADLLLVAGFLTGYMSAKTFRSRFDTCLFGEHGSMTDGVDVMVGTALGALINLMNETGMTRLPNRLPITDPSSLEGGPQFSIKSTEDDDSGEGEEDGSSADLPATEASASTSQQ